MKKVKIKNVWKGLELLEKLMIEKNIDSNGFERNFISIDKIVFIQELIFMLNKLFEAMDVMDMENRDQLVEEMDLIRKYIDDVLTDFEMHRDDLDELVKKVKFDYLPLEISSNNRLQFEDISSHIKFNANDVLSEKSKEEVETSLFDTTIEILKFEEFSDIKKPTHVNFDFSKLISDGFPTKYLNEKNRIYFFEILNKLKKSKDLKITMEEGAGGVLYSVEICNDINMVDMGYIIEIRKLGLSIKIKYR